MLLIEGNLDTADGEVRNKLVLVSHGTESKPMGSKNRAHSIRVFMPSFGNGPLAGDVMFTLHLSAEAAAELKAHL